MASLAAYVEEGFPLVTPIEDTVLSTTAYNEVFSKCPNLLADDRERYLEIFLGKTFAHRGLMALVFFVNSSTLWLFVYSRLPYCNALSSDS